MSLPHNLSLINVVPSFKNQPIWKLPEIGVPLHHRFINECSLVNHPFWGSPIDGKPHFNMFQYVNISKNGKSSIDSGTRIQRIQPQGRTSHPILCILALLHPP